MFSSDRNFVFIICMLIGLPFLLAGVVVGFLLFHMFNAEADRIEGMTPLSATVLADTLPGEIVLVQGSVGEHNPYQFEPFVAYVAGEYEKDFNDEEHWVERKRVTPPIDLTLQDGDIGIINNNYQIKERDTTSVQAGDLSYSGLRRGDRVIAVGTLTGKNDGLPLIEAEFIAFGTQPEYVIATRRGAISWGLFALLFGGIGTILIAVALFARFKKSSNFF